MLSSIELLKKPFTSGCDAAREDDGNLASIISLFLCALILVSVHCELIFVH